MYDRVFDTPLDYVWQQTKSIRGKCPYMDQKNSEYGHFSRSEYHNL